jgi:hypothetical protein
MVQQNVPAVEFGNGDAEAASPEFEIEKCRIKQEVGSVQCHAKTDVENAGGNHSDPRTEISVMHVDVVNMTRLKQGGVINAQHSM